VGFKSKFRRFSWPLQSTAKSLFGTLAQARSCREISLIRPSSRVARLHPPLPEQGSAAVAPPSAGRPSRLECWWGGGPPTPLVKPQPAGRRSSGAARGTGSSASVEGRSSNGRFGASGSSWERRPTANGPSGSGRRARHGVCERRFICLFVLFSFKRPRIKQTNKQTKLGWGVGISSVPRLPGAAVASLKHSETQSLRKLLTL
jgi:hypothetical protein